MTDPRVPVTLLTGFLGSGKTTLLNAILADSEAGRVAIIVNEFGEAGLDHDLIEESSDDIVLMQSGCLCCSVRGDLARTVADLLKRRDNNNIAFERIVIETTGLADPGPILQTLLVDQFLARMTRMDGVVTVADAVNGPATLDAQFEAVSQAAMADLIVLSKTDLVSSQAIQGFEARLRSLNPSFRMVHAVRGQGVSTQIWGLSALRTGVANQDVLAWTSVSDAPADPLANLTGLAPTKQEPNAFSPHDSRIGSASIILEEPIPEAVFDRWLDTLIALRGPDILRIKGIVFIEDVETPFVFHGVQHIFDPPVLLKSWPKGNTQSRIVVIARDLSQPELKRSLDMLRSKPSPSSASARKYEDIQ